MVNVPVGVVGLAMTVWLVLVLPHTGASVRLGQRRVIRSWNVSDRLPTTAGAICSLCAVGLGDARRRRRVPGNIHYYRQEIGTREPRIPVDIFSYREFSLCNVGVAVGAFATMALLIALT
ncbi:hypothetical protein [Mycobacterium uberis]|uniref:hypothetical protein n=1 Tax=Mycobacterium uberis TaxID=2162698 RepID=UPI000E302BA6|nr:hypothetical protein [Mycobacterium uberis]